MGTGSFCFPTAAGCCASTGKSGCRRGKVRRRVLRGAALGQANGPKGVAEYRLLLSHGKVEDADPNGKKLLPRAQELLDGVKLELYFPKESKAKLLRGANDSVLAVLAFEPAV